MIAGGRGRILVALAAVLGIALGNVGCQEMFGPSASGVAYGDMTSDLGPSVARTGNNGNHSEVVQTSYNASGAPADHDGTGYLPVAPQSLSETTRVATSSNAPPPAQLASAQTLPVPARMPGGQPVPEPARPPMPGPEGCGAGGPGFPPGPVPTELNRVSLPPYTIAPPDILFVDTIRLVPKPPYRIEPLEVLLIKVTDTLPGQPIEGAYTVAPEGTINLGFTYGQVRVAGMMLDQIQATIRTHLSSILRNPQVVVALAQFRGIQQTRGEHLVRPDGTISLGTYGCVYVAGMTLNQAKCRIEEHLARFFLNPQVAVDVFAYNSKKFYVILDGGGFGMQVFPFPSTGNETVLDAISNINGLAPVSSLRRIWVARPSPCGHPCDQVLPVDWLAIVKGGSTCTNYQLFPGDRVYVDADCLIKIDNWLAKLFSPVERILGITLLGSSTVNSFRANNGNGNNGNGVVP
jgi:polysaccharide biosynthesis/export protein